jgi:hypothetical protein
MAQNQFGFGLSPQPQSAAMHRPVFGFGSGGIFLRFIKEEWVG